MTAILITEDDGATKIRCIDHADDDRVCAAISMMITATANWVIDAGGQTEAVLDPGYACVSVPDIPGADAVLRMVTLAFEQLAEAEPGHVSLVDYRAKCRADSDKGCATI